MRGMVRNEGRGRGRRRDRAKSTLGQGGQGGQGPPHLIEDGLDVKCLDWLNVARGGELGDTGDVPEHLLHRVNVRLEVRYTGFRRNALVVDRVLELVPDREEARRQVADLMEHERAEVSKVRLRTPLDLSPLHFHPLLLDRVPRRRALGL